MTIIVKIRNIYGEDKIYPVCENAKLFAQIAGTKTLTDHALSRIKSLGYKIEGDQSC